MHKFFHDYQESISRDLNSKSTAVRSSFSLPGNHSDVLDRRQTLVGKLSSKSTLDDLSNLLRLLGQPSDAFRHDHVAILSKLPVNQFYVAFMQKNDSRNVDSIKNMKIFYEGGISKVRNASLLIINC